MSCYNSNKIWKASSCCIKFKKKSLINYFKFSTKTSTTQCKLKLDAGTVLAPPVQSAKLGKQHLLLPQRTKLKLSLEQFSSMNAV